jgi:hypothetical protein
LPETLAWDPKRVYLHATDDEEHTEFQSHTGIWIAAVILKMRGFSLQRTSGGAEQLAGEMRKVVQPDVSSAKTRLALRAKPEGSSAESLTTTPIANLMSKSKAGQNASASLASPVTHDSGTEPPFLILHENEAPVVPPA